MMEQEIRRLAKLLHDCHLEELEVEHEGKRMRLVRARSAAPEAILRESLPPLDTNAVEVRSKTVGVFYAKPSPKERAYVACGEFVRAGQVLGLIESMKVFHPLHAPCDGRILDITIEHGQAIGYDQVLMRIDPAIDAQ